MIRPVEKTALYEKVTEQMMALIKEGEWPEGVQLPNELELSQQFGVSRNCMRESLKSLALYGIVYAYPGKGTFVSVNASQKVDNLLFLNAMSGVSLTELVEARTVIESQLAGLAASRAGEEDKKILRELFDDLRVDLLASHETLIQSPVASGRRFHQEIARIAGNTILSQFLSSIELEIDQQRSKLRLDGEDVNQMIEEHYLICQAICDNKPKKASEAMQLHIKNTYQVLLLHLNNGS